MMKIKILHILHSLQVGGLENGVVNLINNLDPERFEHVICCIHASGPMAERIVRPVRIVELGKGGGSDYLLPFKLARIIAGARAHIIHTRNWGTFDGIIGARLAGVKRVIHGEHGRDAADPSGANIRRNMARRMFHPFVRKFVAVSTELKDWLVAVGIPAEKVARIINGVDTERFYPVPAGGKGALKAALGFRPDGFLVGSVGRLDPVKSQATLLRAFAAFSGSCGAAGAGGRGGAADLAIIGTGPEEQFLRQLADECGIGDRVAFLGERRDIPELMRAMDVFVLPSVAEGISNTILEAMASGLPVLASRVGGNGELVQEGETGLLFGPGEEGSLAASLREYLGNRDVVVLHGSRGRERAVQQFSLQRMVKDYESLYLSVAGIPA